jgi:hypothetical protein
MKINLVLLIVLFASIKCAAQSTSQEPWSAKQLMEPAELAKTIASPKAHQPYIFCIGPGAMIKNSIDIGPGKEKASLDKFKQELSKLPKDANIVIYCGCCPFDHCPNIRPAFTLLNDMKFTNHKLLDIPHNIKVDWKDHNYPVQK